MRVKSDHPARFWRTVLLPLALLVPASVVYTVLLQITHAPSVQTSTLSLVNAVVVALIFWGTGTLLLWRRFWQLEARLFFLMTQSIGVGLLFFLAYSQSRLYPDWMAVPRSAGFHFAGTIVVHFYLTFPVRLGSPRQRNLIMAGAIRADAVRTGRPLVRHARRGYNYPFCTTRSRSRLRRLSSCMPIYDPLRLIAAVGSGWLCLAT